MRYIDYLWNLDTLLIDLGLDRFKTLISYDYGYIERLVEMKDE